MINKIFVNGSIKLVDETVDIHVEGDEPFEVAAAYNRVLLEIIYRKEKEKD